MSERTAEYIRLREARVERTWEQVRDAMWQCGELVPDCDGLQQRLGIMRRRLRKESPPGWKFETMLAAEDVGDVEYLATLCDPEPTDAWPGTRHKVEVLARRVAAGETTEPTAWASVVGKTVHCHVPRRPRHLL